MSTTTYDFVHLSFLAMGGEIRGKTKLQKTVYFLGIVTDVLEDLGYRPHFYGPYSGEVAEAVDRLRALGFVDQTVSGAGSVDNSGFEVARHDFRLNDQGRQMAEMKAKANPNVWAKLVKAASVLKKAGDLDYVKLSIAAKTYFMIGERKGVASVDDLAELARKFGWSVTQDQVQEAAGFLQQIGLVELSDRAS
jgi:uncharacterized protein